MSSRLNQLKNEVKNRKENPAPTPKPEETPTPDPAAGTRKRAGKREEVRPETKSKRFQVLMKPSLHARMKTRADELGISVNDFINQVVEIELDS